MHGGVRLGNLGSLAASHVAAFRRPARTLQERHVRVVTLDQTQEFLVQPVDASWLQCNIECQEACPVGTNCRGYLNLAAEGRFEEGYILSREPNPVAAMCSYVCSAPCERACRRGDIDRPLAIRAMKRFLVEWHEASGIPDVMPQITPRDERVAVVGAGPAGLAVARELATRGYQVTVFDGLPFGGGTMLIGVPAFRLPREAIEMDVRLVERLGVRFVFDTMIGIDVSFEDLQRDYDAIAITAGAMNPVYLDVPGADLDGVKYGIDYMKQANLGLPLEAFGGAILRWPDDTAGDEGLTVWHVAGRDSKWFSPSDSSFMINYRVDDLVALLAQLRAGGVEVVGGPESHENGKFAWIMDPDGN